MRLLAFILLATLATACDDPANPGGGGEYYLNITYSPAAVTLPVGGSVTLNIVVTRGGLYPGTITLTTSALPNGVIPTFNPPVLSNTDRGTLTLTAGNGTVAGPCPFTITASGQDVESKTTPTIGCVITGQ